VQIEIINTGSELMLGSVLNTHQQWLCRELAKLGYVVTRQTAVADSGEMIEQTVREGLSRADLVITTGGLGPTSDDITRDRIAQLLDCALHEDSRVVQHIEEFFAHRHRAMPGSTRVQALVPESAIVLPNAHGTAPGLVMEVPGGRFRAGERPSLLIMLPGPPRELRPMFSNQVVPLLRAKLPAMEDFLCRTFLTTGLGESLVEERIAPSLRPLIEQGLELGYCARVGEVELRCVARGASAVQIISQAERTIRELLPDHIFGVEDETLESSVVHLLIRQGRTVSVAESCTGGFIAHRLTNVPGASAVFRGGFVTYSNEAKEEFLGVRREIIRDHGAVSAETARAMAEGARHRANADYAIAVTGIAGPSGGTEEKPVGTVFIALASNGKTRVIRSVNRYDRETFKFVTSQQALDMLRRVLLKDQA
jgi:nicotinamide-nucleotide amidase